MEARKIGARVALVITGATLLGSAFVVGKLSEGNRRFQAGYDTGVQAATPTSAHATRVTDNEWPQIRMQSASGYLTFMPKGLEDTVIFVKVQPYTPVNPGYTTLKKDSDTVGKINELLGR